MAKPSKKIPFPLLQNLDTQQQHALSKTESLQVGRSSDADVTIFDKTCSRKQFAIDHDGSQWLVKPLSPQVSTLHNGQPITDSTPLEHGSVIAAGDCTSFCLLERADDELFDQLRIAEMDGQATLLPDHVPHRGSETIVADPDARPGNIEIEGAVPIQGQMLIGRDRDKANIHLEHPHVSRAHARVTQQDHTTVLADLNSSNGTFVDGVRVGRPVTLQPGAVIDIGPYSLRFDGRQIVPDTRADNVELIGRGLKQVVADRQGGEPLTLLTAVNLVARPREFLCIVGPAGSGKSTLLSALSARIPAIEGQVTINGEDLYTNFEALKQEIAVVSHDDVLHDRLTLRDTLTCTARLRLPVDTTNEELNGRLNKMLGVVGLDEVAETRLENLTTGQRKRASLANEIISEPSLVFLDEITTGLDEQDDAEMMQLFRQLAEGGKTVVCSTHNLANVEQSCHLLVALTTGGMLAFVGSPQEALEYFEIKHLGELNRKLAGRSPEKWESQFESHGLYARYIDDRMPADDRELVLPANRPRSTWTDWCRTSLHQFWLVSWRYLKITLADRSILLTATIPCLLISLLLWMVFGNISANEAAGQARDADVLLFLMGIVCLWFGCNNSAREIVKERAIYTRERDVNLGSIPYYLSKFCLLGALSAMQTLGLFVFVNFVTGLPGSSVGQLVGLLMLTVIGVSFGLAISTFARNENIATASVPLVLGTQVLLTGALGKLDGIALFLAKTGISSFWARRFFVSTLPEELKSLFLEGDSSLAFPLFVLVLHAGLLIAVALGQLIIVGRRDLVFHKARQQWLDAALATIGRGEEVLRNSIGDKRSS